MEISRKTYYYGKSESQCCELFLPEDGNKKKVVCLIHGGFWLYPYDKNQMNELALNLVQMGFVVWNIEYRRIGEPGGGWSGTFDDILAAVNYLGSFDEIKESEFTVVGHSAGGHLALWLSHQRELLDLKIRKVIALAPVTDLIGGFELNMGEGAVQKLLGTTPTENKERYLVTSPFELLPYSSVSQVIIHGTSDEYIDIRMTNDYIHKAHILDCDIEYIAVKDGYHLDFLDPLSLSAKAMFGILK